MLAISISPAWAQQQEEETTYSTESSQLKGTIGEVVQNVDLWARLHIGTAQWTSRGPGVLEDAVLLGKSIDSQFPAVSTYEYGIEAGLRYRQAELIAGYFTNAGLRPSSALQYDGGTDAVPVELGIRRYVVQGHYLFSLTEMVNAGVSVGFVRKSTYVNQIPERQSTALFNSSKGTKEIRLRAPVTVDLGRFGIEASVGGTVWSSHTVYYDMDLVRFPTSIEEPTGRGEASYTYTDGRLQTWTAYLGTRIDVSSSVLRVGAMGSVTTLPDVFTDRTIGLQASLGLPF